MKIDFGEVARTSGARASYDFSEELPPEEQFETQGPVTGGFSVSNTGRVLVLRGRFTASVLTPCSRCLEPAEAAVEGALEEEFRSQTPGVAMPTDTIDAEEPAEAAYCDGVLDLTELLRQQVSLSLPLRPLCSPDCSGLCPSCGKNLNRETCSCAQEAPSARGDWRAQLATLAREKAERGPAGKD